MGVEGAYTSYGDYYMKVTNRDLSNIMLELQDIEQLYKAQGNKEGVKRVKKLITKFYAIMTGRAEFA